MLCSEEWPPWVRVELPAAAERNIDISSTLLKCETPKHLSNTKKLSAWLLNKSEKKRKDLLQLLALSSLEFTAPATSSIFLYNHNRNSSDLETSPQNQTIPPSSSPFANPPGRNFIQLSGHPGILAPAGPHTLWKKLGSGSHEKDVYTYLKNGNDKMYDIIPKYHSETVWNNEVFIELEDLFTTGFNSPLGIMDIKMGSRTFLESEVLNSKERTDLYEKMIKIDPNAPTAEEHERRSITKLRYMQFREEESSTSRLSFRIEAIKFVDKDEPSQLKSLKVLKDEDSIGNILTQFFSSDPKIKSQFLQRLKEIRSTLESSQFFQTHEVIGSSILLIRDAEKCDAWMIDFAKTVKCESPVNHRVAWEIGNHEDGYLHGLDHLINIIESL